MKLINYNAWSIRMRATLKRKECLEVIDVYDDYVYGEDGEPELDEHGNPRLQPISAKERARRKRMENRADHRWKVDI